MNPISQRCTTAVLGLLVVLALPAQAANIAPPSPSPSQAPPAKAAQPVPADLKTWTFVHGLWVNDESKGQGEVKTYCDFRLDHTFRCDTMERKKGSAGFAYGRLELLKADGSDFVLRMLTDRHSPLNPGQLLDEPYRIIDHDTIQHIPTGTVVKRVPPKK